MLARSSLALSILLAACSGSSDGAGAIDAKAGMDSGGATVMEVTCPATVPITVTDYGKSGHNAAG